LVDSGQWPTLRLRRECLPMALDEGLRLTAAVPVMTRNVVAPTRLGGRAMDRDDRVIVLLFKALQSPALLDEPLRFDIERDRAAAPPPLWFGHGPHFCLGAALARRELEVALTALLDLGDLAIVRRRHACAGPLPGYGELQVRLAARGEASA
jgi:cytochrome P450